jgi:hypothetical protein
VRHMRMLGFCLVAVFAMGAVFAGSALAKKDPYSTATWAQYKYCPYENYESEELTDCFYGRTSGGSGGGEFQYGHVRVKLKYPIVIQGGFKGAGQEIEVSPALREGGQTLEDPEPEPIVKGLNTITAKVQEEVEWPEALKESFKAAKKANETKASVKIEMAGTECYEVPGCLSTENLLFEEGVAFRLSLKVTVHSAWLESLGGGPCTIGTDEHPIKQLLTSEAAGRAGELTFSPTFTQVELKDSKLVDTAWHIEPESAPSGCGGPEYESYVDAALSDVLELYPWKTGITWLTGDLHDASMNAVLKEGLESGELP